MEEIKNPRSVEMSDEEFAEFQAFRQEQARKAAEARVEKLRTNYAEMAEAFISRTIKKLTPLSEQIRRKKAEVLEEAEVLQRLKAELLEIDGKQMPKSHTFTNAAGDKRVTIGVYETDGYDDTVDFAFKNDCHRADVFDYVVSESFPYKGSFPVTFFNSSVYFISV